MKTIILWLMITPGQWEVHNLEYSTHAICVEVENMLRISVYKRYFFNPRIKEIFKKGGGIGMFFIGCHK